MFNGAESLVSIDLSLWDVSSIENMSEMFSNTHSLKRLDLNKWSTVSATNMSYMFSNAKSLESLVISDWNVSTVTDISSMFSGLESLETLDVSNWNVSSVESMRHLFSKSTALKQIDLKKWNPISVTNTSNMFENADSIQSLNLSNWTLSNLTNMSFMFSNMASLESLNVDNWKFSNKVTMMRAFYKLDRLKNLDLGSWDLPNGSSNLYIFAETPLESLTLSSSFKFDKYQDFPEIISSDKHSGKWVNIEEPHKVFKSSKAFLEEFSSADAGTYIRQETYTIKYVLDKHASHNNRVSYNQYEGIPKLEPAYNDYATFMGWYDGNMNLIESIPKDINRDITLTAKFLAHEFIITYVLDGGINHEENPTTYKYGVGVTEFKEPTKVGYDFIGWYDEDDQVVTSLNPSVNGDMTLYAKYEVKEYAITYGLDGGINNEKNPTSYVYGEGVTVFFNPVKENHKFKGWVDSEGNRIKSILETDVGDRVLKAVWKENKTDDQDETDSKETTPPTGVYNVSNINLLMVLISLFVIFIMKKKKA